MKGQKTYSWPALPYKGLSYYGPEDIPLFAGREIDVTRCAAMLAHNSTRILILHGTTGCGKSSFLRAGLIPFLEKDNYGFEFFKSNPMFIRSTDAPLVKLSEYLYDFLSKNYELRTPIGNHPIEFSTITKNYEDRQQFLEKVGAFGKTTIEILGKIASVLPKTIVLVIDQCEEVLTLKPNEDGKGSREKFFSFIEHFSNSKFDLKLLISLRTEFYGRFKGKIPQQVFNSINLRDYLLNDFNEEQLVRAIEQPTSKNIIPNYGKPYDRYLFSFENGLSKKIASDLQKTIPTGGALPVMQIVCGALYATSKEKLLNKEQCIITESNYQSLGGIEGQIEIYLNQVLVDHISKKNTSVKETLLEADRWKSLLCELIKLQVDGTVTTELKSEEVLVKSATHLGCRVGFKDMMDYLSSEKQRIINRVEIVNLSTGQPLLCYSLGHDAIGLVLHRWKVTQEDVRKIQQEKSQLQKLYEEALAYKLAINAGDLLSSHSGKSLICSINLAIESLKRHQTVIGGKVLRKSLSLLPKPIKTIKQNNGIEALAISPDGQYFVTIAKIDSKKSILIFYETLTGEVISSISTKLAKRITFCPDGRNIIINQFGSDTSTIYDVKKGKKIFNVNHELFVDVIKFSDNGKLFAISHKIANKAFVTVWDINGKRVSAIPCILGSRAIAFDYPEGKHITFIDQYGSKALITYEIFAKQEVARIPCKEWIISIAISPPHNRYLAAASTEKVMLWKKEEGFKFEELTTLNAGQKINSVVFSLDGELLAVATGSTVEIWKVETITKITTLSHSRDVFKVEFCSDGNHILTISEEVTVHKWEMWSGREITRLNPRTFGLDKLADFSRNGEYFIAADWRDIRVWKVNSGVEIFRSKQENEPRSITFSPNGEYIAIANHRKGGGVWEISSGNKLSHTNRIDSSDDIAFSSDGKYLATISWSNSFPLKTVVHLWYLATGSNSAQFLHDDFVEFTRFSPNRQYLVTGSTNKKLRVWDILSKEEIKGIEFDDRINSICFSPDGQYLALAIKKAAIILEVATWSEARTITSKISVQDIEFSADGKYLALVDYCGEARVFLVKTWDEVALFTSSETRYTALSFTPDGKYLAIADQSRNVKIWDVAAQEEKIIITTDANIIDVAFSPDGKYLATANDDFTSRIVLVWTEDLISEAIFRLDGNRTHEEEWRQYIKDKP